MKTLTYLILFFASVNVFACGMAGHDGKSSEDALAKYSKIDLSPSMTEEDAHMLAGIYIDLNAITRGEAMSIQKVGELWHVEIGYGYEAKPSGEYVKVDPAKGMLLHDEWSPMPASYALSIRLDQLKASTQLTHNTAN